MMNKKLTNRLIGKPFLLTLIVSLLVVAGIVVSAIFGLNKAATADDRKLLTVSMDSFVYETQLEVDEICEKYFDNYDYKQKGAMSGASQELSYSFSPDEILDDATLNALEKELSEAFPNFEIRVSVSSERVVKAFPMVYLVRALIAGAVFCVLAFAYTSARHNLATGSAVSLSMWTAGALTFSVFALTRIPLTTSFTYVLFFALIATAIVSSFTFRKIGESYKTEADKDLTVEERTQNSVATKEILTFTVVVAIALVLLGAIATHAMRMVAIWSLIALILSVFSGWIFAPSVFVPLKKLADKKAANRARYDYKKQKKVKPAKKEKQEETAQENASEEA